MSAKANGKVNGKVGAEVRVVAVGREADALHRAEFRRLWAETARRAAEAGMTEQDVAQEIEHDRAGR